MRKHIEAFLAFRFGFVRTICGEEVPASECTESEQPGRICKRCLRML